MSCVYVLKAKSNPPLFKIGRTGTGVSKRIQSLKTGCPYPLEHYATIPAPDALTVETEIHERLDIYRTTGEWFAVSQNIIDDLLSEYKTDRGEVYPEMENLIVYKYGIATCRICELSFLEGVADDEKWHAKRHKAILRGNLPFPTEEFLKAFGWAVAHNDGGLDRQKGQWSEEEGKRAVVFSYWSRARGRDTPIPDELFETFCAWCFGFVDAMVDRNTDELDRCYKWLQDWL